MKMVSLNHLTMNCTVVALVMCHDCSASGNGHHQYPCLFLNKNAVSVEWFG